jgi:hypothetical protein
MARQVPKKLAEVFLDFWTFRQAIQLAGLLLACLLTVFSAVSEETPEPFMNYVTLTIRNVTNGTVLPNLSKISGTVRAFGLPVDGVVVHVREILRGKEISCVAKLGFATTNAAGETELTWTVCLPRLRDGRYEMNAQPLVKEHVPPNSVHRNIVIDGTSPEISFAPLHDQQVIADFSEVGGEIDEVAAIELSICRVEESIEQNTYWNGVTWTTNRDDHSIRIRAGSVGDLWFAPTETALPKATEIPAGNYLISAFAFDRAGNEGRAAVTVIKKSLPFSVKVDPPRDAFDESISD